MHYPDHLQSPRLTTRFLTPADQEVWMEYCTDPIATTYTRGEESPAEMAQRFIEFTMKRYAEGRYGLQALISRENGAFIGACGLITQEVNGLPEMEIGYHLLRRHWGKGYATEAAQIFRDFGFENRVADSIVSIIHPLNEASKAVAMRNGMRLVEEQAMFRDKACNLFRITRQEWETIRQDQSL